MLVILTTLHTKKSALQIANGLLRAKLIACYNLHPIESGYWWKGRIMKGKEVLVILKAKDKDFSKIEAHIKKNSGYEVPEVIALRPARVNASYLRWVAEI